MSISPSPEPSRFLPRLWALAGALSILTAYAWYRIGLPAHAQLGIVRTLGLLAFIALALVAVAAVVAGATRLAGWERAPASWHRALRVAFVAGSGLSLAGVGLSAFHSSPHLAPMTWKAGTAIAWLVVVAAMARYSEAEQRFVTLALTRLGLAMLLVPALASPYWVYRAVTHATRVPEAPSPPAAPALPGAPERIVIVTFDALPARATSLHTPTATTTPALAELARRSSWFTNARATADSTIVSLPAMLSGVSPSAVQPHVDNEIGLIRDGLVTGLAGHLAPAGYQGLYATMWVNPRAIGFGGEFVKGVHSSRFNAFSSEFHTDEYIPVSAAWKALVGPKVPATAKPPSNPQAVVDTFDGARRLLAETPGRVFLWVHIGAPHEPYIALPRRKPGEAPRELYRFNLAYAREAGIVNDRVKVAEAARSIFGSYLNFVDGELEHFLVALEADPAWERTMLIVTADHGEAFEPGRIGHANGPLLSDHTHVPLLIHAPGQAEPRRVDTTVGHLDVAPTVLEAVYGRAPAGLPGRSLAAPVPGDRVLYTYGRRWYSRWRPTFTPLGMAAYHGAFTYVQDFEQGSEQLYDHAVDPLERQNVAGRYPHVAARLKRAIEAERASF